VNIGKKWWGKLFLYIFVSHMAYRFCERVLDRLCNEIQCTQHECNRIVDWKIDLGDMGGGHQRALPYGEEERLATHGRYKSIHV
jgi:hypothetical protein